MDMTRRGFSLLEVLIGLFLIGAVFLAAISVYTTGLRFLQSAQNKDVTTSPAISVEDLSRKMTLANNFSVDSSNRQLNVSNDTTCAGVPNNTPSVTTDDCCWHYRFISGALRWTSASGGFTTTPVGGGDAILIPNLNTSNSNFAGRDPSTATAQPSVVDVIIETAAPVQTVRTTLSPRSMRKMR